MYLPIMQSKEYHTITNQYFLQNVERVIRSLPFLIRLLMMKLSPREKNTRKITTNTMFITFGVEKPRKKMAIRVSM